MSSSEIIRTKRIAAGIIAFLMLVIMLCAHTYIAAEAEHDCEGGDCPVCACIRQCESMIDQISNGTRMQLSVLIPLLFLIFLTFLPEYLILAETPVLLKVRLNN